MYVFYVRTGSWYKSAKIKQHSMDNAKQKRGRPKATEANKRKRIKAFASRRVYLGTQHDRWTALKKELRLNTNRDLAQLLIDSYMTHKGDGTPHHAVGYRLTSSPVSEEFVDVVNTPSVSEVLQLSYMSQVTSVCPCLEMMFYFCQIKLHCDM